jgi:hypothetical protein
MDIPKKSFPPHAKRVFEGVIFDVYQWEQELYDGRTVMFERLVRPDTVTVYGVLPDGKILLAEQEQPGKPAFVGPTGGRVDPGEDALTAAKRELRGRVDTRRTSGYSGQPQSQSQRLYGRFTRTSQRGSAKYPTRRSMEERK